MSNLNNEKKMRVNDNIPLFTFLKVTFFVVLESNDLL